MRRVRILAPIFFERYFDSDFAAGTASLKTSFFWMVAFLAAPGIFMPVMMSPSWSFVGQYYGLEQLDEIVRADKVLYLGYSAWAIGMISTLTWNAMLLDRRDGLVLGGLPVTGRDVIGAKVAALCVYAALLMVAMHLGSAIFFGIFLGNLRGFLSIVAVTLAAFTASSLCSLFVVFSMMAMQGVTLLLVGGRRFAMVSPWLQLIVIAALLGGAAYISQITNAVTDTLAGTGSLNTPWILNTPMLWYLGVYDVMLGMRDPQLLSLARTGLLNLGIVVTLSLIALPLSYTRVMTAAVEQTHGARRRGITSWLLDGLARLVTRHPQRRGVAAFLLLSLARHGRPRLALAAAIGGSFAWSASAIAVELSRGLGSTPSAAVLGVPLAVIAFLTAGFRVAASLPSELPPRWVFASLSPTDADTRAAVRRTSVVIAVLAPASLAAAAIASRWGGAIAAFHFAMCVSTGLLLVELAFYDFTGVPCARAWRPDGANLRAWWPVYLGGFLLIVSGIPKLELYFATDRVAAVSLAATPFVAAIVTRVLTRNQQTVPEGELDEPDHVQLLNL